MGQREEAEPQSAAVDLFHSQHFRSVRTGDNSLPALPADTACLVYAIYNPAMPPSLQMHQAKFPERLCFRQRNQIFAAAATYRKRGVLQDAGVVQLFAWLLEGESLWVPG